MVGTSVTLSVALAQAVCGEEVSVSVTGAETLELRLRTDTLLSACASIGIKRHLLVDTRGTVMVACVSPANISDRNGAVVLFSGAADAFPRLRHVWADQGDRGADFHAWAREATGITVQVVQRRDGGFRSTWARADAPPPAVPLFAVVPRRWVVERGRGG